MAALTRADLLDGLRALGLQPGDRVLVHSSLSALGPVEGGAETVIDALLEACGNAGLVAVPTFGGAQPFDRRSTATSLGAIADAFWRRPGAVRSLHPTHSVAAIGPGAADLLADHERAATAYGENTPYHRLATTGGKILLLGVDQDRNTTLHTAETLAGAVYLGEVKSSYVNDAGETVTITVAAMAGPHRDFLRLDHLFRERGVEQVGKIGGAVCRLLDAGGMLAVVGEALRLDPAAVLCDNPACRDCVWQRGKIKTARLAAEDFTLAAVAGDISEVWEEVLEAIRSEAINAVEITAEDWGRWREQLPASGVQVAAVKGTSGDLMAEQVAGELGVPLIVPVGGADDFAYALGLTQAGRPVYVQNTWAEASFYEQLYAQAGEGAPPFAFNPGRFAGAQQRPFLQVCYQGTLRRRTRYLYLEDALRDGTRTLPGRGEAEVKEILSALRCRSWDGVVTLRPAVPGVAGFRETAAAFWRLLDEM
ncbi:MAG TPA: AAC(3) family N-acetyltransferase [Armatimonadota bacterium]|jgi:aminoglycoside 3-N-acetyltransferase